MSFGEKIIVAIDINKPAEVFLPSLGKLDFLKHSEIHFVYIFQTILYPYTLTEYSFIYPVEEDRLKIENEVIDNLKKTTEGLILKNSPTKIEYVCLFDENPKKRLGQYALDVPVRPVVSLINSLQHLA